MQQSDGNWDIPNLPEGVIAISSLLWLAILTASHGVLRSWLLKLTRWAFGFLVDLLIPLG